MSEDETDTPQAQAPPFDAPEPLGPAGYDALQSVLLYNVEQGNADVLLGLSDQSELDLVRLAFHDTMRLDRLERVVQGAIRDRQDGEGAASRFSLGSYRRSAQHIRKQLQEERARIAKLRQRNARILQGDKDPREGTDVELPGGSSMSAQAMCEAAGSFLRAAGLLMVFRAGRIWFDDFYGDFFTDWSGGEDDTVITARKVEDAFMLNVHGYLLMMDTRLGTSSTGNTEKALHFVADRDHRNEPRNWIRGLQWDGEARLEQALTRAYGSPDDEYHRAVGRCWFVSMAARINDPGCKVDTMPVLYGPQGTFKSTSLEVIGGKWYATINTTADSKDFLDALRGLLVAEVAELDAISGNRVENSRVKTLLSTRVDRYRPPYGRTSRDFRRTAVLVGTTNDQGWHRDETGGRRFWPIHCAGAIDLEWLRDNREQLFAEAQALYAKGGSWSDVPREEQERLIAEHLTSDPWEDRIRNAIAGWRVYWGGYAWAGRGPLPGFVEAIAPDPASGEEGAHWGTLLTTNRIAVLALGIPTERQSKATSNRIARAMRAIGWEQTSVRVSTVEKRRAWVKATGTHDDDLFDAK